MDFLDTILPKFDFCYMGGSPPSAVTCLPNGDKIIIKFLVDDQYSHKWSITIYFAGYEIKLYWSDPYAFTVMKQITEYYIQCVSFDKDQASVDIRAWTDTPLKMDGLIYNKLSCVTKGVGHCYDNKLHEITTKNILNTEDAYTFIEETLRVKLEKFPYDKIRGNLGSPSTPSYHSSHLFLFTLFVTYYSKIDRGNIGRGNLGRGNPGSTQPLL